MSASKTLLTTTALLLAATALARECWLELPSFYLKLGTTINIRPLIGDNFIGQPWSTKAQKVRRLVRFGPTQADSTSLSPINPAPDDTLHTALTFAAVGTHVVLLQSHLAFTELPADQFTAYLRTAGLDNALRLRQLRGQQAQPGREAYQRCAKALVQVGDAATVPPATDSTCLRPLDLPLELVPEQNPYHVASGKSLTVRVLRAGAPVTGALVQIWQRQSGGQPTTHFTTRTNSNGRLLMRLTGPGPYLLATVGMTEVPKGQRTRADWLSTWASLTFGGPPEAFRRAQAGH